MKKIPQFSLRSLLIATTAIAVMLWLGAMYVEWSTVIDFTDNRSSVCKVHAVTMHKQLVDMSHGMRGGYLNESPEQEARRTLFPNTDEPLLTGFCCPTVQTKARTYVCHQCNLAHETWLAANTVR